MSNAPALPVSDTAAEDARRFQANLELLAEMSRDFAVSRDLDAALLKAVDHIIGTEQDRPDKRDAEQDEREDELHAQRDDGDRDDGVCEVEGDERDREIRIERSELVLFERVALLAAAHTPLHVVHEAKRTAKFVRLIQQGPDLPAL